VAYTISSNHLQGTVVCASRDLTEEQRFLCYNIWLLHPMNNYPPL